MAQNSIQDHADLSSFPPVSESGLLLNHRARAQALRAAQARRVSGRLRLVDPTTCERDYSSDEMDFMKAIQEYKKSSGRMFPTWSEVLKVVREMGYRLPAGNAKLAPPA